MRKGLFLIVCLTASGFVQGQSFSLSKSQYLIGEKIAFDAVVPLADSSAYFWVHLLDPMSHVNGGALFSMSHQAHLIEGRIHRGEFITDDLTIKTGPYLMTAFTSDGFCLGLSSLFLVSSSDQEIWRFLMDSKVDTFLIDPSYYSLPVLRKATVSTRGLSFDFFKWETLVHALAQNQNGFASVKIEAISGRFYEMVLPPTFQLDKSNGLAYQDWNSGEWIINQASVDLDYDVLWNSTSLMQFQLPTSDSIWVEWNTFPTGVIKVNTGSDTLRFLNKPSPQSTSLIRLNAKKNSILDFTLPNLSNAFVDQGNHFVNVKVSQQLPSFGLEPSIKVQSESSLPFIKVWVEPDISRDKNFNGLILMDSTDQFAVHTQADGSYEVTASLIYSMKRGGGRVRLGQMNKNQMVRVSYPEMEHLFSQIMEELAVLIPKMKWTYKVGFREFTPDFNDSMEGFDLDELVIKVAYDDDQSGHFELAPFAVDWINTDFLCHEGAVLNCMIPEHGVGDGNRVFQAGKWQRGKNIPLHIFYRYYEREARRDAFMGVRGMLAGAGVSQKQLEQYDKLMSGRVIGNAAHPGEAVTSNGLSPNLIGYSWKAEPYLANMAVVQYFRDDLFEGFLEAYRFNLATESSMWLEYGDDKVLQLEAGSKLGEYYIQIDYWDMYHHLMSTLLVIIEVKE